MAKKGFVRKYATGQPKKVVQGKTAAGKFLNGVTYAGTKVGQWTVRPGLKAYDAARGKKK